MPTCNTAVICIFEAPFFVRPCATRVVYSHVGSHTRAGGKMRSSLSWLSPWMNEKKKGECGCVFFAYLTRAVRDCCSPTHAFHPHNALNNCTLCPHLCFFSSSLVRYARTHMCVQKRTRHTTGNTLRLTVSA